MSCFDGFSSRRIDGSVLDIILERGQKLRDDMVQTILKNSDFTQTNINSLESPPEKHRIKAFLQGDAMSREEELLALETLRSMSPRDLCRTTNQTYRSSASCKCSTCIDYREDDLVCDLKRASQRSENIITKRIRERYKNDAMTYLKYVDSLKISVNYVLLNEAGFKKVSQCLSNAKYTTFNPTFFVDYSVPVKIVKPQKTKSKVDSGLNSENSVRICARMSRQQEITFKQASVHDITNLTERDLSDILLKFNISFRNFKHKGFTQLGCAMFRFSDFEVSKNFTCVQELVINFNEKTPINVGFLKVALQLGCGHLYFGKEFIDAIRNNRENSVALGSDEWSSNSSEIFEIRPTFDDEKSDNSKLKPSINRKKVVKKLNQDDKIPLPVSVDVVPEKNPLPVSVDVVPEKISLPVSVDDVPEKIILFGFVYISETRFFREVLNSFLTCQLFGQNDFSSSKSVTFDASPDYNFSQQIPLVYSDDVILKFRENFMVVEFYEKSEPRDFLVGYSKLNLHQFYLAFRNPVVVKYLIEKQSPVIGIDGWEPIFNSTGQIIGHTQVLQALGTREQIEFLEASRGFKKNSVKARESPPKHVIPEKDFATVVEVGVQSDMDLNKEESQSIEKLLSQLVAQKPRNISVENATNTETTVETSNTQPAPDLKSTSELLESLEKALSLDTNKPKDSFKVQIAINSALHLPLRRRCKSRTHNQKRNKPEDVLPSAYVTFEAMKGDINTTHIVAKSTNPKWDYRREVSLPLEYLTDNQKFLVFKVWRKLNNSTTMTPDFNADVIIGFATVDLTVLSAGLPNIQGWFNINDLSKKCKGQINIHVTPLENISQFKLDKAEVCCPANASLVPQMSENSEEPAELLGRALKRKFTELDEITQRLRLRLSKVTNDESDASNDDIADEFERDINTLCVEDDFDMIDFEKEARNFNINHTRDGSLLITEGASGCSLSESKQKIDTLLEKLSLLSAESSSRYVSGCSEGQIDTEAILNELDHNSRPNIYTDFSFDKDMTLKYGNSGNGDDNSDQQVTD